MMAKEYSLTHLMISLKCTTEAGKHQFLECIFTRSHTKISKSGVAPTAVLLACLPPLCWGTRQTKPDTAPLACEPVLRNLDS